MKLNKILPALIFIVILAACDKKGSDRILRHDESGSANTSFVLNYYGLVVDGTNNTPLIGADVLGKGTTNGTHTNGEGKFNINIGGTGTGILEVRFIGYDTKLVTLGIYSNLGTIKLYPGN